MIFELAIGKKQLFQFGLYQYLWQLLLILALFIIRRDNQINKIN